MIFRGQWKDLTVRLGFEIIQRPPSGQKTNPLPTRPRPPVSRFLSRQPMTRCRGAHRAGNADRGAAGTIERERLPPVAVSVTTMSALKELADTPTDCR